MKKVALLITLAVACVSGAFAQKQTGGEKNFEVQFAPLGGNPISTTGFRFRMFNSETSAIRIGLFIGGSSSTEVDKQVGIDPNDPNSTADSPLTNNINKAFSFSLRPGYEMHFAGTDRLSPYWGVEALFGITRMTETNEVRTGPQSEEVGSTITKDGSTTLGLNAVFGADFYFSDAIYIGAEFGFGFASTSMADTDVSFEGLDTENPDPTVNGKSSSWGPNYQGTIRLGWLFN